METPRRRHGLLLALACFCLHASSSISSAFLLPLPSQQLLSRSTPTHTYTHTPTTLKAVEDAGALVGMSKEEYLATLPEAATVQQAEWQYILVERMEPPTQTQGGLFLPSTDQDPLHMVRIVSKGSGQVGESGVLTPLEGIGKGDLAVIKQPWGIGPRDDIFEGRKFSWVRQHDVLALIDEST